ncbi:nitrate ABC transporter, permease protein [Aliidongia dinghuensis]|uniref:Nitrate ABC transporter, permease protein n=2 Tax=Aliidongia dinghuensis TaxID=1867774 RepID=A0A8J2YRQ4_9PROT|nr:nitrate ABC transporter, permease protein [Aliidongia dinghuensis]
MTGQRRIKRATLCRLVLLVGIVGALEILCLDGAIDRLTMPPPHRIVLDMARMLVRGSLDSAIAKTLTNAAIACGLAIVIGIAAAILLHRARPLRRMLDPLFATYYAIPVFAFYPMLIILFGLGDTPQVFIGFMLGVVAVIVNTLNGLDRVPRVLLKTARVNRMDPFETAWRVTLPSAAPYILTGAKLAVAYSLIGIIGAEFILSNGGMGYEISFAYTNFDNATMYPLILLILAVSIAINMALARWEKALMARRGLR